MPITLDTMACRETFSRYVYELHEHVNTMLKKKSGLSFEEVQERYEHFRARCLANQPPTTPPTPKKTATGCTEPLFGKKSKCLIKIVPIDKKAPTFEINKQCIRTRQPVKNKTLKRLKQMWWH